ncbi:hypothetical protein tb265_10360 [Gemmatimonadetes bacterium T265]|nr:hypothetical protein tb265_10360 [Gemmatimonadetes bacterium T265]
MAVPKIKGTYSLDPSTVGELEQVAKRWGVSKSEAIRRAIHAAAEGVRSAHVTTRLDLFDQLQQSLGLDQAAADAWVADVRAERDASPAGRRYWPDEEK